MSTLSPSLSLRLSEFDYPLDEALIAQRPADRRDQSRLLVIGRKDGTTTHAQFSDLPRYLRAGDLLIVNDTRVWPVRLVGGKPSGGRVELLLVREVEPNVWEALVRGRHRTGQPVVLGEGLKAELLSPSGNGFRQVRLEYDGELYPLLERYGEVPLPPYIRRSPGPEDRLRYQTVFAKGSSTAGSVAAPTAGLHFTEPLIERLRGMGVRIHPLTLQVGPGTFRPIRAEQVQDHRMDPEWYSIPEETVRAVEEGRRDRRRVIAVGTTAMRALESAADEAGRLTAPHGLTSLFIHPGYRFRVIGGLLTNFHLPRSTPLLAVSALAGRERLLAAYGEAMHLRYRFLSYGDAMLIL
jgi:S-adenosylmethionine:tRNA ribosyltransferase-isomerase